MLHFRFETYLVTSVHSRQCHYMNQSHLLCKQDTSLNDFFNYKIGRLDQMIYKAVQLWDPKHKLHGIQMSYCSDTALGIRGGALS